MMLEVRSHDPDLQHRGRVLAFMLLGMSVAMLVLSVVNVVQGDIQYIVTNAVFISLMAGLLMLNRFGFVRTAGVFTVVLTAAGSLSIHESVTAMYTTMTFPILIASSLLAPWSGFLVAALMMAGAAVVGEASLSLLILVVVAIFSYLFADSLERAYRRIRYQAFHDSLTDLPNRALFLDRLGQVMKRAARKQETTAVLFLDIDNFKVINDSLGHELGDKLLIQVSRCIGDCLRPGDTTARLGGDEFIILLEDVSDVAAAVRIAERIVKALEVPVELDGRRVFVNASIGIAVSEDADERPSTLLRNADVAMYEAKQEGKTTCKVFNQDMYARALRRLEMENDLRQAIERSELKIHYQPTVLLSTGRIASVEALLRWEHPDYGLIRPKEFIPLAEDTKLIVPVGRWVLREACRQAREWQKRYPTAPPLVTSVNLSVTQFQEPTLVQEVMASLRETELDPRYLQLEVTESVVADDVEYANDILRELKRVGVRLAIDDFGTGYSLLLSLRRFPFDSLKIDKAFVDELGHTDHDTAIVRLMIDLAHTVSMQAIAEGVTTTEQLAQLRDMGCDQAQGYYFWEPLVSEEVEPLLTASPRRLVD
jgi:diguanylate cyclase (GGDEF)-like protein